MKYKYLQETTMNLSPDTGDNPTTGGGTTGGQGGDDGKTL